MQKPGPVGSLPAHWASAVHGPQVCSVRLQIGRAVALQSASATHSTQMPASTSQTAGAPSGPPSAHWLGIVHLKRASPASLASFSPEPASPASTPLSPDSHALVIVLQVTPFGQWTSLSQYFGFFFVHATASADASKAAANRRARASRKPGPRSR